MTTQKMNKNLKARKQDRLDEQDFYELMQSYRHVPIHMQKETTEAFEAVKSYIRDYVDTVLQEQIQETTDVVVDLHNMQETRSEKLKQFLYQKLEGYKEKYIKNYKSILTNNE